MAGKPDKPPQRPNGHRASDEYVPDSAEHRFTLAIPRLTGMRETLEACKARALEIAAKNGITREPDVVEPLNDWFQTHDMTDPEGYRFVWHI